jgi:Tol biopolymer transport system component/DNA-binding winged helix-turn-helix (wHTH) protein
VIKSWALQPGDSVTQWTQPSRRLFRFDTFEVDLWTGELRKGGTKLRIQEQPLKVLAMLLNRQGELVTREELQQGLWSQDTFVDFDRGLNTAVNRLRSVLNDPAETPRFVETVGRRGYRFIGRAGEFDRTPETEPKCELATDEEELEVATARRRSWRLWGLALGSSLLVAAAVLVWLRQRQPSSPVEFHQRQLTANSTENAVTGAAISQGGDYLAYADLKGIHVETVATGDTQDIPQPESLRGMQVSWNIVSTWGQNGTGFLANAIPHGQRSSIWFVPLTGEAPRKLRDDAVAWTVSRDGSSVAFGSNLGELYYREIWLMKPDGGQARKLFEAGENTAFAGAEWSPDGQRLSYIKWHPTAEKYEWTIESRDLKGGPPVAEMSGAAPFDLADWSWSPNGRIIYSLPDPTDPRANTCNFWQSRVDAATGEPLEKPRLLTNWSGFCMDQTSLSADGKRLAFRKSSIQSAVYLADVRSNGTMIGAPQRFTLNEGRNYPAAWTADSKSVVFASNRNGRMEIFRQSLDQTTAEPIGAVIDEGIETTGTGLLDMLIPRLSPDGASIMYLVFPRDSGSSTPVHLMKIPVTGGRPQLVLTTTLGSIHSLRCAKSPASLCVLAERSSDQKHLIFSGFDPVMGRGRQLVAFDTQSSPDAEYVWDLSADGTRIAILRRSESAIHLISLRDQAEHDLKVEGWGDLQSLDWTADDKGLFVSSSTPEGSPLLRVDLDGHAKVLWEVTGSIQSNSYPFFSGPSAPWAVPSPDGRHLAICVWSINANVWMIENL